MSAYRTQAADRYVDDAVQALRAYARSIHEKSGSRIANRRGDPRFEALLDTLLDAFDSEGDRLERKEPLDFSRLRELLRPVDEYGR